MGRVGIAPSLLWFCSGFETLHPHAPAVKFPGTRFWETKPSFRATSFHGHSCVNQTPTPAAGALMCFSPALSSNPVSICSTHYNNLSFLML